MKVCYLCDYDLNKGSGKERATRQKLEALKKHVEHLYVVAGGANNLFLKVLWLIGLDMYAAVVIIAKRPDIFISRGYVGVLSVAIANFLNIKTVREVHSDLFGELDLLPFGGLKKKILRAMFGLQHFTDCRARVRIFNHPDLMNWYHSVYGECRNDFYCYNGFDPSSRSSLSRTKARQRFGLPQDKHILVFTGAASEWHGVEYVVDLQREFNKWGDNVKIVCGGGEISRFDEEKLCINVSPLDDQGCADLMVASDVCLLPVKFNRVSPGSPLKLYDYILNCRYVISQADTNGYSDEVLKYGVGWCVDFTDAASSRLIIINLLHSQKCAAPYPRCAVSWQDRMLFWVQALQRKGSAEL